MAPIAAPAASGYTAPMPIIEKDPWRDQYFVGAQCPDEVTIPTDDMVAWRLYPKHRWVYNKLLICETQGIEGAPHGVDPASFPVFSKPIYNMHGMGVGTRIANSADELARDLQPGHMWMRLLEGEHVSTDVAVENGEPRWWRHTIGKSLGGGVFDYWTVLAEARPEIESYCGDWLRRYLGGYTGCVNFETIGARIIEGHLRFADQWPDLYGQSWLEAVLRLYVDGRWDLREVERGTGYSVVLFGAHGRAYESPDPDLVRQILADPVVSSVQITFDEAQPPAAHAMPPGGFRLAIVNCWDLETGMRARERLALDFASRHGRIALGAHG
jgi:hypothetical protein